MRVVSHMDDMKKVLPLLALFAFLLVPSTAYSQTDPIPPWVKTVFEYYVQGEISESELLAAIEYLIQIGLITVSAPNVSDTVPEEKIPDDGDFYVTYGPNPNSWYEGADTAEAWLRDWKILEHEIEFLNEYFRLPHDVEIAAEECGEINAFYYPEDTRIVMCYEFVDDLFETWYLFNEDGQPDDAGSYAYDVFVHTFYHELAHAMIDVYDLPITGLEENVADQFAALMLSYTYDDEEGHSLGQDMLHNVGTHYLYEDEYWNVICPEQAETPEDAEWCAHSYWDVHGSDIQRFYNISCYTYGSDPTYNEDLIKDGWLPEERAANCEFEYWQINSSWNRLLDEFTNGFFYEEG